MQFNDKYIANLKPKDKRYNVKEDSGRGNGKLTIRVSPNGNKSWLYLYNFDGRDRWMTLGSYPAMTVAQAHEAVGKAKRARELGIDPGKETTEMHRAERAAPTVAELAADYLELYAKPRKRSADRDEELLNRNVLPTWGAHKANSITRGDAARLLDGIVARGAPVAANRTRSVLSTMFRWALERELVERNPVDGVRAPGVEHKRDRVLTANELEAVLSRLDGAKMQTCTRLAIRLQFLTAARIGEVAGAMWTEIDEAAAMWTIPPERSKNKRPHRLPLSTQALAVLREARALDCGNGPVFPTVQTGKALDGCVVATSIKANLAHFAVDPFTPHDIRRTVATGLSEAGASRVVVGKVLNHTDASVTAIYDRHEYTKEMREALGAWGDRVAALELAAAAAGQVDTDPATPPAASSSAPVRSPRVRESMRAAGLAKGA